MQRLARLGALILHVPNSQLHANAQPGPAKPLSHAIQGCSVMNYSVRTRDETSLTDALEQIVQRSSRWTRTLAPVRVSLDETSLTEARL